MLKVLLAAFVLLILAPCAVVLIGILYLIATDAIEQKHYWNDKRKNQINK